MAVTITAHPSLRDTERLDLLRRALVHMAQASGPVQAEVDLL